MSLTGEFKDALNEATFYYYKDTEIDKIYPRYGPKDGGTPV